MDALVRSYIILAVLIAILIMLIVFIIKSNLEEKLSRNNSAEIPVGSTQTVNEQ